MTPNVVRDGGRVVELWLVAQPFQDLHIMAINSERLGILAPKWTLKREEEHSPFGACVVSYVSVGPFPSWLEYETEMDGWNSLLDINYSTTEETFLLQEGIAPGQPFKVRFKMPHYSKDYYGEYDVSYRSCKIVEMQRWSQDKVLRAWGERMVRFA